VPSPWPPLVSQPAAQPRRRPSPRLPQRPARLSESTLESFEIGYAPIAGTACSAHLTQVEGLRPKLLEAAGLVVSTQGRPKASTTASGIG